MWMILPAGRSPRSNRLGYEIINLGGHEVITINGLVELVEELTGKKANVQYGPPNLADMFMNQANVTKAREMLGWNPQVNLTRGYRKPDRMVQRQNEVGEGYFDTVTIQYFRGFKELGSLFTLWQRL